MLSLHVDVVLLAAEEKQIYQKVQSYYVELIEFVHFGDKKAQKQELCRTKTEVERFWLRLHGQKSKTRGQHVKNEGNAEHGPVV